MKDFNPLTEPEQLKLIYQDIVNGYSLLENIFIKHFSESSHARIIEQKQNLILGYNEQGLPTNEDRQKEILEQKLWSQEKEDRIIQLQYIISDNEKYAQTMVVPSQKEAIMKIVNQSKNELIVLNHEKTGVMGPTCEVFAGKELENFFILELFYKDDKLSIPYLSREELDAMENDELEPLKITLNKVFSKIQESHIQKVGCMPFFLNTLGIVRDRPETFFRRPIHSLSFHQHNLLSTGLRNLNIGSQTEGTPPSLQHSTVEELVKWYDQQYSVLLGKAGKSGNANQGPISMTNTDVAR